MLPVVGSMLPRRQRQAIARISVSALVASLPLLYVSLLRPPPSALAADTAFWFLMSNCVIAAIVAADDAGALFKPKAGPCDDDEGDLSYVVPGDHQPVAVEDGRGALVVPLAARDDEPAAVYLPGVVQSEQVRQEEFVASKMTSRISMDGALPFLIEGEGEEEAASKSSPDLMNDHALALQRGGEEEDAILEPSTHKNNTMMVENQGGGEVASPSSAPDETIPVDELATVKADDRALVELGPAWPRLATSKSVPEEVQEEEAADDECCPPAHQYRRAPGVLQGKRVAAAREGKLQRSATDGSRSEAAAEEESEYSELSDEELNRRVEEFIARFNREMRLQVEQEAGV